MADIIVRGTPLGDLKDRARELAAAVESLATLFEREATRLQREDEVFRLGTLRSAILQSVDSASTVERAASNGHRQAALSASLVRVGLGLVTRALENPRMQAMSRQLLAGPTRKEPTFGTVLVRIGPVGVPQDMGVVSISELARESRKDEREVTSGLIAQGNRLFSGKDFSSLIDILTEQILKCELSLPISTQRLYKLAEQYRLRLSLKSES